MVKLGLGTVQLGIPYGNQSDRPLMPESEAADILETALKGGIRVFDTAIAYGESEKRLGDFGLASRPGVEILTKISSVDEPRWRDTEAYWKWLQAECQGSRTRLKLGTPGLLQFHQNGTAFLEYPGTAVVFARLLAEGLATAVGVSVYEPGEALAALRLPEVTALQVPVNLLDDRFVTGEVARAARERGVRVIGRSVFLQGILVEDAPLPTVKQREALSRLKSGLEKLARTRGESLSRIALSFALMNHGQLLDTILIGVDSRASLEKNLSLVGSGLKPLSAETLAAYQPFARLAQETGLVDPRRWSV